MRYTYDIFGNKTTMTTYRSESVIGAPSAPQGDVTTWLYDIASGFMTNKVYADGKGPAYSYTPDGKLSRRTWARGITTDYAYDSWGSLTNTVYSDDTPTISLSYDALGRQVEAHDGAGITTFLYDSFGSLTNETVIGAAGTNTIERFYDTFGRDAGYALNGVRQTTIGYCLATARISMMLANGSDTPFAWNILPGSDLKSSLAYPNGVTASWQYDANNQLFQVCNATPTNVISQYDYTYDGTGRRVACGKSGSAFVRNDTLSYGYNNRSELTNAVAAVDSNYRYAYDFDDIGNRESSSERGTNVIYSANNLNQYTAVDDFAPQFDDDGNQTRIKTSTGIWQVSYNGENRPIRWENGNTFITMSYDRMGRRITKNDQRFAYNGYLQIADNSGNAYVWDPTEKVATRPLVWFRSTATAYYTHDGNKNVSELASENSETIAHYDYAPFGAATIRHGASAIDNPWRFSCEYTDDTLGVTYYNFRHYNPVDGKWMVRDPIEEDGGLLLYGYCMNAVGIDYLGLDNPSSFLAGVKDPQVAKQILSSKFPNDIKRCIKEFNRWAKANGYRKSSIMKVAKSTKTLAWKSLAKGVASCGCAVVLAIEVVLTPLQAGAEPMFIDGKPVETFDESISQSECGGVYVDEESSVSEYISEEEIDKLSAEDLQKLWEVL